MKARVLLIEDSKSQAVEIRNLLEHMGYEVLWADGGISGLKVARKERPDIILLDVVMPDMDGYTVCRWLKLNEATREIPIIMLTVKGELENRIEGLEKGANDYLAKPFNERELEARIYAALRTKALQTELKEKNRELKELLQKVEVMAITDPLTGLHNRRRFYDALKKEFASTKRYNYPLSCMLIDIDYFKKINDRYGHLAGDQVLKEMARILSSSTRETDILARFGGEEFVLLLPHTSKENALAVAERMIKKIRNHTVRFGNAAIKVTASIGIASLTDLNEDDGEEDLLRYADAALYAAKEKGRNRIETFSRQ